MPIGVDTFYIYSNDGSMQLGSLITTENLVVAETIIAPNSGDEWTYSGDKKFLGFALTANATEPTYKVDDIITVELTGRGIYLYIVEGEREEKPIFTYDLTQLNLAAGTYSITIVAKAAGYNDAPSNAVQFVVEQESFVEETNEYGTTMVINKYTEEPNEYGTTMIIGGETTTNLISFTIAGTTYQAEEGMTWGDWLTSEYNTGGYGASGNYVMLLSKTVYSGTSRVYLSNTINANEAYTLPQTGGVK